MSAAFSFEERFFLAAPNFRGLVAVLDGFFDETGTHNDAPATGVAGFLFDKDGLIRFNNGWNQLGYDLPKPYHTVKCVRRDKHFRNPAWPQERCDELRRNLARLTATTRLAGFVSSTTQTDFANIARRLNARASGSIYATMLVQNLEMVGWYAKQREQYVHYWFEQGDEHQTETAGLLAHFSERPDMKERFRIGGFAFIDKGASSAMYAADMLAWEWQRNYGELAKAELEGRESTWKESENFVTLCGRRDEMFVEDLGKIKLQVRGIAHAVHRM